MRHGAGVQVGDVAHVHRAEIKLRRTGHRAVHHFLHQKDGGRIVGSKDRAEHGHRIDHREFQVGAFPREEIPGRAFRQGLRFGVGSYVVAGRVCPVRLIERRFPHFVAIANRRERGSQHHTLYTGVTRGAQDAECAFACGDN